jgi:hypothetical protein
VIWVTRQNHSQPFQLKYGLVQLVLAPSQLSVHGQQVVTATAPWRRGAARCILNTTNDCVVCPVVLLCSLWCMSVDRGGTACASQACLPKTRTLCLPGTRRNRFRRCQRVQEFVAHHSTCGWIVAAERREGSLDNKTPQPRAGRYADGSSSLQPESRPRSWRSNCSSVGDGFHGILDLVQSSPGLKMVVRESRASPCS